MSDASLSEKADQNEVYRLFTERLGYRSLGELRHTKNTNVREEDLRLWLKSRNEYSDIAVDKAVNEFVRSSRIESGGSLRETNRRLYTLLRYGVGVVEEAGKQSVRVHLMDWHYPENNDFAVAEEVTVSAADGRDRRPDIVLYVNGIALCVLELKRFDVPVEEAVRQNIGNQHPTAIAPFFTTVQMTLAGNVTQGLRYGTVGSPEEHYLLWREEDNESEEAELLHRQLSQVCGKARLMELVYDFVVFDGGVRKVCRHNQYFGVKRAQERIGSASHEERDGGIIWHTQGSGKSLTMVWLARWLRENIRDARILIITDRTELDEQIKSVFLSAEEEIVRAASGADLVKHLQNPQHEILCSLIHKFGRKSGDDEEAGTDGAEAATAGYIEELESSLPAGFEAKGDFFVFVDECHRTQSGELHDAMRRLLGQATFVGFTGTPLLKKDRRTSMDVFGSFIHTYKYDEAVKDGSVLDLRYEARDIEQSLGSPEKIDEWFEEKTRGLTSEAKRELRQRWATVKNVHSAKERLARIADDILVDMQTRPRLMDGRGNAMIVTGSIYQAFKLYEILADKGFGKSCAVVSSYAPEAADTATEEGRFKYGMLARMISTHTGVPEDRALTRAATFEGTVKERFRNAPEEMRLLIVVDKLLTGFDAPSATYLYVDRKMQDHGLFQAICRVNRLDGEDKEFGYIVDYKNLFPKVEGAVRDFTGGAFDGYDPNDLKGMLAERIKEARTRLDVAREKVRLLCETVPQPKDRTDYIAHFVAADMLDEEAARRNEPKRKKLYAFVSAFVRAYAGVASEMPHAGYSLEEASRIKRDAVHYGKMASAVRLASGEYGQGSSFAPDMRKLLDTYIEAGESRRVAAFEETGLVDLLAEKGEAAIPTIADMLGKDRRAVAATIERNISKTITDERPTNPDYYRKMSESLELLIAKSREDATDYAGYLNELAALARKVKAGSDRDYPAGIADSGAKKALYDNLGRDEVLALEVNEAVRESIRARWNGNAVKERRVRYAIEAALEGSGEDPEKTFDIVRNQPDYHR